MPMPAVNGEEYQVRLQWSVHNQACFNVLNFVAHGDVDLIDDLLLPVINCVVTNLLPVLSNETTFIGADVRSIDAPQLQEAFQAAPAGSVGGENSHALPTINAGVIALSSVRPGRSGRGRMKLVGIPETRQQGSMVDATFLAAAAAFLVCMFNAYKAGDPPAANRFDWTVRSRSANDFAAIVSGAPKPVIGTQRSRKP